MLGEFLTAGLGSNAMLWRASPVATELEQVVVDWFRQALGLPEAFDGLLTDTASTSTLIALAAAREAAGLQVAAMGLAGRPDVPPPVVYTSAEANLSVEKACMTLGIGRANVRRIAPDEGYRMDVGALAAAITDDRVAGRRPIAIVPTIGTTSTTSVDPVAAIVDLAERERMWVHVDAAYAGAVAIIPERRGPFAGWERADSVTMNPHKWLFTPLDASVLLTRRMDLVRAAFSLVPEYLGGLAPESPARDYNEYTPQLGRRFRALKLWILLRWFGLDGLRRRIERHIAFAQEFADWVAADPDFEVLAPVPFSTVCFRYRPAGLASSGDEAPSAEPVLEALNVELENAVNATGHILLSHTRLHGRYVLRLAVGNLRTEERHVRQAWDIVREVANGLGCADPDPEGAGAVDVGAATDQGTAMGAKIVV
jgi:aromatic-L-amino-acid decarboxylase